MSSIHQPFSGQPRPRLHEVAATFGLSETEVERLSTYTPGDEVSAYTGHLSTQLEIILGDREKPAQTMAETAISAAMNPHEQTHPFID
jgi:hypothetical protein